MATYKFAAELRCGAVITVDADSLDGAKEKAMEKIGAAILYAMDDSIDIDQVSGTLQDYHEEE